MFVFYIFFILLIIATYEDIKKREVYDFLNFLFLLIILVYSGVISLINQDLTFFYVLGLSIFGFLLGSLFYYSGLWGGGDSKFLISIPPLMYFYNNSLFLNSMLLPYNVFLKVFILTFIFLILSFLFGGILSVFVVLYNYFKNFKKIKLENYKRIIVLFLLILDVFFYVIFKVNQMFFLLNCLTFLVWLSFIAKKVEKYIFTTKKPINKIVLGDWIAEDVVLKDGKKVYRKEDFRLGVDEKQLNKLKELYKKKKLKSLFVKDGIPFFIGFLLAFPFFLI